MEWQELIGHIVFIKLSDNTIFTNSKVLAFEEPFLSVTDRDGLPFIINIKTIMRVKIEDKEDERRLEK